VGGSGSIFHDILHGSSGVNSFVDSDIVPSTVVTATNSIALPIANKRVIIYHLYPSLNS
jgi:hypothetical protein